MPGCIPLMLLALLGQQSTTAPTVEPEVTPEHVVIAEQAEAMRPLVATTVGTSFLDAAACLPAVDDRIIYTRRSDRAAMTEAEYRAASDEQRDSFVETVLDETFYYTTRYGSPIANARPYDLAGGHGLTQLDGARICDFGFGSIGSLQMLATQGAHVCGIEIDQTLRALYAAPGDTGPVDRCTSQPTDASRGSVTLAFGRWPAETGVRKQVDRAAGPGFDLVLSKNTLKMGYIHPTRAFRSKNVGEGLIDLGVTDERFVTSIHDSLAPGGLFLIYNLSPRLVETDEDYLPWADGRCPFARELLVATGFEVIAFDVDDTAMARILARALGWDEQGMDVENDLFATFTLVRKIG